MCRHNKVEVSTGRLDDVFDAPTVEVDKRLAPLLRELWAREVYAGEHSCEQRWPGLACLFFPGVIEVEDFLKVAESRPRFRGYKVEVETWLGENGDSDICPDCQEEAGIAPQTRVDMYVIVPARDLPELARLFADRPLPPPREPRPVRRWGPRNN
jgi:hypothetical protein